MAIKHRINWTPEERAAFYLAARKIGPPDGGDSHRVWKQAQIDAGFKPERIRPFSAVDAALMNKERRKGRPTNQAAVVESRDAGHVAEANLDRATGLIPPGEASSSTADPLLVQEPRPVAEMVASAIVDVALRVLYDPRLRIALRDITAEAFAPEAELEQRQAITWRKQGPQQQKALRVVVAGMREAEQVLGHIPGIDFRFWGTRGPDESTHRLKALLDGADVAVCLTKAVRHAAFWMIKEREKQGKLRCILWPGSANELRPELVKLVQSEQPNSTQH